MKKNVEVCQRLPGFRGPILHIGGGVGLGEGDVQVIRQDLGEVKRSLADLADAVADLRVLVAGEYVRKDEFDDFKRQEEDRIIRVYDKIEEYKKEEAANRFKLAGLIFTISAFVFGIMQWVVSLFKNQGGGH